MKLRSKYRGNTLLVWLADDDTDMLSGFDDLIRSGDQLPDGLQLDLRTAATLADFEELVDGLTDDDDRKLPDLIFLDLRFETRRDGYLALDIVKNHHRLDVRSVPVIMFSSAKDMEDIKKSYRKSANAYIEKGASQYDRFAQVVSHWVTQATLPTHASE